MTDIPILREFTLTHDPATGEVAIAAIVERGGEKHRYDWVGGHNGTGLTFEWERLPHLVASKARPYDRVPVGQSGHRISLDVLLDQATSSVTVVPVRRCGLCGQPADRHGATGCVMVDVPESLTIPVVLP